MKMGPGGHYDLHAFLRVLFTSVTYSQLQPVTTSSVSHTLQSHFLTEPFLGPGTELIPSSLSSHDALHIHLLSALIHDYLCLLAAPRLFAACTPGTNFNYLYTLEDEHAE